MSFSPALNVIVLGVGDAAREHLAAIQTIRAEGIRLASGLPVLLTAGLWSHSEDRPEMGVLVREFQIGLVGNDPADMIEAHDIHAVVGCLTDTVRQGEALTRAINAGKSALAVPPLAPSAAEARALVDLAEALGVRTGVSAGSAETAMRLFVESILRREPRLPSWRDWVDAEYPAPDIRSTDPISEIRAALAALPVSANQARAPLERALRALETRKGQHGSGSQGSTV